MSRHSILLRNRATGRTVSALKMRQTSSNALTPGISGAFCTTHWSVILAARQAETPESSMALEQLCQAYWPPLYAYVRRRGHTPEDASDLTQQFFARLLEKNYLRSVEPAKGKFRTFLLTAMERFLANEWSRSQRQKRGGGQSIMSLDDQAAERGYLAGLVDSLTAEKILDRRWAMTVLELTMSGLATECAAAGKSRLFEELKPALAGERTERTLADIARELELSLGAVKIALHRLRRRYGELLRTEVARTVSSPEAVDEEIRCLREALGP